MLIYSSVIELDNNVSQIESLMQSIGSVWNDRVAEHVSEELLAGIVSECHSFAGEMHSLSSILQMRRAEMEALASDH